MDLSIKILTIITFDSLHNEQVVSSQFDTTMGPSQTQRLVPMGKYNRLATKGCTLADFPFVVPKQDHDRTKKSAYRRCSQNLLGAALRHFERITCSTDDMECQVRQLDLLDIRLRWLLHCAMKLVWGTKGDPQPRYILAEGSRTPSAHPQQVKACARTLEGLSELEANRQFGDDQPNIAKAMAADTDAEISMGTFHDHWAGQMTGTLLTGEDLPQFPEGEEYLADLWRSAVPIPREKRLSKKDILNALRPLDGRKAPGYDGLTYFAYKATDRNVLLKYWTSLFNWLLRHRVFLPSWKIALQVFLPKPNKSDYSLPKSWRPITLFPTVYKIACRVISMRASKQLMVADQMSPAQKGGIPGVSGTTDATFLLRSCIDHHRRHKANMYVLFMDVANAFGSLELGLIKKIISLTNTDIGIQGWWIDSTQGCSVHIKSGRNLSPLIHVTRGVAQGNTNSALTFNTIKNTVNLWMNHECVGYQLYDTSIPDLSFVDDEALLSGSIVDMQAMLHIHEQWSEYASLRYDDTKCAFLCEEFWVGRILSPRHNVLLCGQEIPQLAQGEKYRHLGLDQNFGRVAGSGNHRCGESAAFFPDLYKRLTDLANQVNDLTVLHRRNHIELLDQNVKSIAMFAIQAVEVPLRVLEGIDAIVYRAVRTAIGIGPKQGPVCMLQAPTRLRGLRIKSMVDIYREALICNTHRWLNNDDGRLRAIFLRRVEDAHVDCGIDQDVDGTIFFDYRIREIRLYVHPSQEDQPPGVQRVSYTTLGPRLQFDTGRTLIPLIYQACVRYQVRIDSEGDMWIYSKGSWIEVESARMLRSHLRTIYIRRMCSQLCELHAWSQWSSEASISSKSYRWLRRDLTRDPQYQVACQMLFNVLPCNSLKEVWNRRSTAVDPKCNLCNSGHNETVKHILCSCSHPALANLRNARHNKIVREICIWLEIVGAKGRFSDLQVSTHLRDLVDPSVSISPLNERPDICFTLTQDGVKEYHVWEITVPMDNVMHVAIGQKQQKYAQTLSNLSGAAETEIQYQVFVFGVMGAILANFEKILRSLAPSSKTDWLVDEIHKALLYYNHALWCTRDQEVRAQMADSAIGTGQC